VSSSVPGASIAGKTFVVEPFVVSADEHRRTAMVTMRGELDLATVSKVTDALERLAPRADGVRHVVLDLRGLTFMDSSGVRVLLKQREFARTNHYNLAVVRGNDAIQRLLALTGIEELPVVVDDPEDLVPPLPSPTGRTVENVPVVVTQTSAFEQPVAAQIGLRREGSVKLTAPSAAISAMPSPSCARARMRWRARRRHRSRS
jgi:anti-sigma B factor antagonist